MKVLRDAGRALFRFVASIGGGRSNSRASGDTVKLNTVLAAGQGGNGWKHFRSLSYTETARVLANVFTIPSYRMMIDRVRRLRFCSGALIQLTVVLTWYFFFQTFFAPPPTSPVS